MWQYSKDGINVGVWLDTRKMKMGQSYPVKIRVTHNRKRAYFPTGKDLTPEEWAVLLTSKHRQMAAVRRDIENSYNLVRDAVEALALQGVFSFESLKIRLQGAANNTINKAFRSKVAELEAIGRVGNASVYNSVLTSIEKFGGENIPYNAITTAWLSRYVAHLQKIGNKQATIAIRLRTLRAILNDAKAAGIIKSSDYPFGKGRFEIQSGAGRKMALTLQQIGKVARYSDGGEATEKYRDYWLFLYYCNGINVADFVQLRYRDITGDEIYFKRQKTIHTARTLRDIRVVIIEPMRQIIERWGNPPTAPNTFIFPHLNGTETPKEQKAKTQYLTRLINRKMAYIAEQLGIPHISTYTARHSFATVLKRSGANIAYISESLGHSDLKTTENYLASFEIEERRKNAELLTQF